MTLRPVSNRSSGHQTRFFEQGFLGGQLVKEGVSVPGPDRHRLLALPFGWSGQMGGQIDVFAHAPVRLGQFGFVVGGEVEVFGLEKPAQQVNSEQAGVEQRGGALQKVAANFALIAASTGQQGVPVTGRDFEVGRGVNPGHAALSGGFFDAQRPLFDAAGRMLRAGGTGGFRGGVC